jgi:tRNA pseudouridine38-40 synthase
VRVVYEGGAFRGYQRQPGLPTVQERLEEALAHLGVRGRIDAAARTDAGVHALGQVVSFTSPRALDPAALRAALNAALPDAVLCLDAARVTPGFHARASAVARTYVYLVGAPPPPALLPYAWSLPDARAFPALAEPRLDPARAREALALAVGEHDFAGFARPGDQTARGRVDPRATVRELVRAELHAAAEEPLWAVVLEGRGFLRAMARNLVGTVVAAAVGACFPSRVAEVLAAPRERYRGVRAPAWGLTLARVSYRQDPFASPPAASAAG